MASYRICLCFSDTGGGHRSAAEAIEAAIYELVSEGRNGFQVNVSLDNVAENSHPVNRWFVDFYNFLLRYSQPCMKYYQGFIEVFKPNDSQLGYWLAEPYLSRLLRTVEPSVVVSVHPMVNHYLAQVIKKLGLINSVRLITVITDPNANLWTGWACSDADLIVAPNDLAKNRLIAWGLKANRVKVMGMPIHPEFLRPPTVSRADFLNPLGLNPDGLTICLNAGVAGGGNMLHIYRALGRVRRPIQVIFLCGQNQELFHKVKRELASPLVPTAVLPFHDSMWNLMSACDLMVTKAGGLTTFEAVARRLPMAIDLVTEAMPQEVGTAELLIAQDLAKPVRSPQDIVAIVESLEYQNKKASLPSAHNLDHIDAVYDIARSIIAACDPTFDLTLIPESSSSSGGHGWINGAYVPWSH